MVSGVKATINGTGVMVDGAESTSDGPKIIIVVILDSTCSA